MIPPSEAGTINGLVERAVALGDTTAIAELRHYIFSKNDKVAQYTTSKIREVESRTGKKIQAEDIGVFLKQFKKSNEEPVVISSDVERLVFKVVRQREQFRKTGRPASYRTTEENELMMIRMGGRRKEVDAALEREWAKRRG